MKRKLGLPADGIVARLKDEIFQVERFADNLLQRDADSEQKINLLLDELECALTQLEEVKKQCGILQNAIVLCRKEGKALFFKNKKAEESVFIAEAKIELYWKRNKDLENELRKSKVQISVLTDKIARS